MQTYKIFDVKSISFRLFFRVNAILVLLMLCSLKSIAQEITNLSTLKESTTINILREIEKQTSVRFAYSSALNTSAVVSIPSTTTKLPDVLNLVLKDSGLVYRISGNFIIIEKGGDIFVPTAPKAIKKSEKSQKLIGVVQDSQTGELLSGATVLINGVVKQGVTTNSLGQFELKNSGQGDIKISVLLGGYQDKGYLEVLSQDATEQWILFNLEPVVGPPSQPVVAQGKYERQEYFESNLPAFLATPPPFKRPVLALKTNLLYAGATLTPNLGVEVGLGPRSTFELSGSYNRWHSEKDYDTSRKLAHLAVSAEYRMWLCERFNGHFFGVGGFYSFYNVGKNDVPIFFEKEYRYQGSAVGLGVSYGYHLMLSRRLGLEFTAGVGAVHMSYDKYECQSCGAYLGKIQKTYFAPTKLGISLVYIIK